MATIQQQDSGSLLSSLEQNAKELEALVAFHSPEGRKKCDEAIEICQDEIDDKPRERRAITEDYQRILSSTYGDYVKMQLLAARQKELADCKKELQGLRSDLPNLKGRRDQAYLPLQRDARFVKLFPETTQRYKKAGASIKVSLIPSPRDQQIQARWQGITAKLNKIGEANRDVRVAL